jgi:prephenate dehydrogenase
MPDDFCLKDSSIGILGLGLMGGSLALALRGHCRALLGSDPDAAALEMACQRNVIDAGDRDPARLLSQVDVLILAAPVPAILDLLEELPSLCPNGCIVMDLGSTKRAISAAMRRLPERFDPIGGHPLCGKETLSLANAEADLYREAPFVLTPLERTSSRAWAAAHQIVGAVGARAVILKAEEHDRILAATSHLPFLLSSALALTVPVEFSSFAGPGFKSTSRLAGTPSSMMLGVLRSNRDNVLNALHQLQAELTKLEEALSLGDFPALELKLNEARSKHQRLVQ